MNQQIAPALAVSDDDTPPPELRGAALAIQTDERREIILSGPARSSKTFGILYKFHHLALTYPGARMLFIRQTRESLTESALVTFEQHVVHLPELTAGPSRATRHAYSYSNGSEIVVAGFRQSGHDQTEKIMSTEWDRIFVNEVPELHEDQWEKLTSRLTHFAMPYQQIVGDMNPAPPSHWVWRRQRASKTIILRSELTDNPRWYDAATNTWTTEGQAVYDTLNALTGFLRDRLFLGLSVAPEGLVYGDFSLENLTDDEPDPTLSYELAVDDGYIDPRATLFIQRTGTRVLIFDELYHTRHLEETCVNEALDVGGQHFGWRWFDPQGDEKAPPDLSKDELFELGWVRELVKLPELAVVSHEAPALRARYRKANIAVRIGLCDIKPGISNIRSLILDGNQYRTLKINRRCKNTIEEITEGYKYPSGSNRRDEELPVDENNHACDALSRWAWLRARSK